MIVITAKVTLRPEAEELAIAAVETMTTATLAEPGCISYRFYRDLLEPTQIFVFEEWESEAALAEHFAAPHMAEFRQHVPHFVASDIQIQCYEISAVKPL